LLLLFTFAAAVVASFNVFVYVVVALIYAADTIPVVATLLIPS